jgi:hypothetical protein
MLLKKSVKDLLLLETVILHGSFEIESAQSKVLWQELKALSGWHLAVFDLRQISQGLVVPRGFP